MCKANRNYLQDVKTRVDSHLSKATLLRQGCFSNNNHKFVMTYFNQLKDEIMQLGTLVNSVVNN